MTRALTFPHLKPSAIAEIQIKTPGVCPMCDNTGLVKTAEPWPRMHAMSRNFDGSHCLCCYGEDVSIAAMKAEMEALAALPPWPRFNR